MTTKTRTALVSLLAIALLAWFLSHANLREVWRYVKAADVRMLLVGVVFIVLTYVTRTFRWQVLLAPLGRVPFSTTMHATIIGFAALSLLPARAGDLLRPYLVARKERLSAPAVFATVVLERVLDLVAVLGLLAVYVWGTADPADLTPSLRHPIEVSAAIGGSAAVVLFVVMWMLASHPERIGALVRAADRVLPHRIAHTLADVATAFSRGFEAARSPRTLFVGLCWSFPLWVFIASEAWAVTRAFDIPMPFTGAFLVQVFLVIGVAVPTPGGVGSFHEAYRWAVTTFFHVANDRAVAAAIVVHLISFLPIVILGLILMVHDGLSVHQLQELAGEARDTEMPHSDEVPLLRSSRR
ncbi:MAG TPA: lysylphosphatidylglycerol synthase transmembrane domain-containing protein [Vicinamibacterales bacterium]|nr:lysylphosphatidylglycerol synthase transmembrane domain-containing protein [Vicinamibacterales bacterium]